MSEVTEAPVNLGKPNLQVFAETLQELAEADASVLAVTSDSRGSARLVPFGEALPKQIVETGIAEQNLVGIAAGLAATGKRVFAVSPACFLTARSLEQIKNDVCYSDQPVTLVGISAGVSYGALGSTHHSLHDLAALRAIHNITVVVPADNFEAREAVRAAAEAQHPVYLRFGKRPLPDLHGEAAVFEFGKALTVREGEDIALLATGETVDYAEGAARLLEGDGLSARVLSLHTVKPLDEAAVLDAAETCRAVVTVEEHSVHGGLGDACASLLMQRGVSKPFRIIGIPDEYTYTGSQTEIFEHYGITPAGLADAARSMVD